MSTLGTTWASPINFGQFLHSEKKICLIRLRVMVLKDISFIQWRTALRWEETRQRPEETYDHPQLLKGVQNQFLLAGGERGQSRVRLASAEFQIWYIHPSMTLSPLSAN